LGLELINDRIDGMPVPIAHTCGGDDELEGQLRQWWIGFDALGTVRLHHSHDEISAVPGTRD
jgi:hypothetical protein